MDWPKKTNLVEDIEYLLHVMFFLVKIRSAVAEKYKMSKLIRGHGGKSMLKN